MKYVIINIDFLITIAIGIKLLQDFQCVCVCVCVCVGERGGTLVSKGLKEVSD